MNRKMGFACTAIAVLLVASILPVVESERNLQMENSKRYSFNSFDENSEMIEVPVQIYTLHGVKEIKKKLPVNEARELFSLSNKTGEAVKTLLSTRATFREKARANGIIDSFLYKMKRYGLLGNLSINETRELITGKYLQKERNSLEMRKMAMIANFLNQNGWEINAMCGMYAWGAIIDCYPWNLLLVLLDWWGGFGIISSIAVLLWIIFDAIPHPTTIGYWEVHPLTAHGEAGIYTLGLLGEKEMNRWVKAITIGFTGVVIMRFIAIGFCPFVAMKPY